MICPCVFAKFRVKNTPVSDSSGLPTAATHSNGGNRYTIERKATSGFLQFDAKLLFFYFDPKTWALMGLHTNRGLRTGIKPIQPFCSPRTPRNNVGSSARDAERKANIVPGGRGGFMPDRRCQRPRLVWRPISAQVWPPTPKKRRSPSILRKPKGQSTVLCHVMNQQC